MSGIEEILLDIVQGFGIVGVFATSFLGAASIFIPIPYHVLIFWVGANTDLNIYAITAAAGAGSALGEMVGYGAGYAAKSVFGEARQRKLDAMLKVLLRYRTIWPLAIFFFALTPLPDDVIFVPLGIARMGFVRIFIPCLLGKLTLFYLLVVGSRYLGDLGRDLLGGGEVTIITTIGSIIIFIVILTVMLKVDWEKILSKR